MANDKMNAFHKRSDIVISRPEQTGCHFEDGVSYTHFMEKSILIDISVKFVSKVPVGNMSTLLYVMASCRTSDTIEDKNVIIIDLTHVFYLQSLSLYGSNHCVVSQIKTTS